MCDRVKIAFITWKLLLLGENFILGLTPSLKNSGMPFSILPCGRSFSVIRAKSVGKKINFIWSLLFMWKSQCNNSSSDEYAISQGLCFGFLCFENEDSDLFVAVFLLVCALGAILLCVKFADVAWNASTIWKICQQRNFLLFGRGKSGSLKWSSVLVAMIGEVFTLWKNQNSVSCWNKIFE